MRLSLNDGEIRTVWEVPRVIGNVWSVVGDKIFLWRFRHNTLQVVDMMFEPAHHPLADVINKHKNSIDFTWIYAHPSLPFAILFGGKNDDAVISWEREDTRPKPLVGEEIVLKQFLFSPDGKWLTFKTEHLSKRAEKAFLMRPLGAEEFVDRLELEFERPLKPEKPGPKGPRN
jgi:hypothetical protein